MVKACARKLLLPAVNQLQRELTKEASVGLGSPAEANLSFQRPTTLEEACEALWRLGRLTEVREGMKRLV